MCKKCEKSSCNGCGGNGGSNATTEAQIAQLNETVESLTSLLAPFLEGHPFIGIQNADDIALFDFTTGKGSDRWALWAICDGSTHKSIRDNKMITTPNFTDRFIVQAGGIYSVDDIGGSASVTLATSELPAHKHLITDPGHTHVIADPGHDHPITDPGHTHGASAGNHTHDFTTDSGGLHNHTNQDNYQDDQTGVAQDLVGGITVGSSSELQRTVNSDGSAHTHTGTTDNASGSVTVNSAFTGVDVTNAFTGITNNSASTGITETQNEGSGTAHENRPPYYAAIFAMLIG